MTQSIIKRYESVDAYLPEARAALARGARNAHRQSHGYSWDLGVSCPEAIQRATYGDASLGRKVSDVVDRIAPSIGDDARMRFAPALAGSRVNVPAFLSGNPYAMRRRVRTESSVQHVAIYVELACSAGIEAEKMVARGATILALLESLQQRQVSVDLYLVCTLDAKNRSMDHYQVIRVESKPLDLSTAGFAIAHPAFTRNCCYATAEMDGYCGWWSPTTMRLGGTSTAYEAHFRELFELAPSDIYIPQTQSHDTLINDPTAWIETRLSQVAS